MDNQKFSLRFNVSQKIIVKMKKKIVPPLLYFKCQKWIKRERARKASALPKEKATKVNVNFISQSQITILLNHRRVFYWLESVIVR